MSFDFDAIESRFVPHHLSGAERTLVERHDGSVVHMPTSVAASVLGLLMREIEEDIREGEVTQRTATKYVYAQQIDNCVHDEWNAQYTPGEQSD